MGRKPKQVLNTEENVVETPVVETPVVETPVVETPVVETPVVETPVVETPVSKNSNTEETVTIPKAQLDDLFKRLDKMSKDQELLFKASDKTRLAKAMNTGGEENLIRQAGIKIWDDTGKMIIATKLITNRVEVTMGKWVEEQTISLILEDGEAITVPYLEFVRKTLHKAKGDIIARSEETDEEGNKSLFITLQFPNGKKLKVNSVFLN